MAALAIPRMIAFARKVTVENSARKRIEVAALTRIALAWTILVLWTRHATPNLALLMNIFARACLATRDRNVRISMSAKRLISADRAFVSTRMVTTIVSVSLDSPVKIATLMWTSACLGLVKMERPVKMKSMILCANALRDMPEKHAI
jgi:hypothetical protein